MVDPRDGSPGDVAALPEGPGKARDAVPPWWLRWGPQLAAGLALLLTLPSMGTGLSLLDDLWQQQLIIDRLQGRGGADPWYAIFDLVAGDSQQAAQERLDGRRPWWSLDTLRIRFFRPLSVATHYLDNALFPDAPWAMHLHSVLWYGLACLLAGILYRRLCGDPRLALAAACLYAVDDAHVWPAAWIANRNAMIAACFLVAALITHDQRRREGSRTGAWLSPALWFGGLLCSESGLSGAAFFLGYAAYYDRGPFRKRLLTIAPHAILGAAYLIGYRTLGYGARGSGLYLDPLAQPGAFLANAPSSLHFELFHQVSAGVPLVVAFTPAWVPTVHGAIAFVLMPALGLYAVRRFGRSRELDFGVVAGLLSLIPYAGLPPHERALFIPGIGLWLVITHAGASALSVLRTGSAPARVLSAAALGTLALLHAVVSPVGLAVGTYRFGRLPVDEAATVPALDDPPLRPEHIVVLINAPDSHQAMAVPGARLAAGLPVGARTYRLGTTPHEVEVYRPDAHTLQLGTPFGFVADPPARFWRSAAHPFRVSDRFTQGEIEIEIARLTYDGRPQFVRFRFERPLDDPNLRFITWYGGEYREVAPPAVGETHLYPAHYDINATPVFAFGGRR